MRFPCALLSTFAALLLGSNALPAQETVPAVLLSDIHFDPFHNPRLLPQLRAAPIERWPAILDADATLPVDADRAALQVECHAPVLDTAWPLLKTALVAAHDAEPHPLFVTLSGDLLAHQFPCRFHHLAPSASAGDLAAFSAKTVAFVALQLRLAFPHVPVYIALGNNDSGCADYDEDPGSAFVRSAAASMSADARPAAASKAGSKRLLDVSPEDDYSVTFPAPLQHGRLIVLDDIYAAENYRTCGHQVDRTAAARQVAWLRAQLADARAHHQQVWVMEHIPPGIDVYASFAHYVLRPGELCSAQTKPFLADSALADTLLDYPDIVRLALFAHTHMDEIRLLHRTPESETDAGTQVAGDAAIPAKLVPSVTPYFGNHPAFLVAEIDPRTLILKDWQAFVSPSSDGSAAPWPVAYRFSTAYGLPDLSAASAQQLADGFTADPSGKAPRSHTYRDHFYAGDIGIYALGLAQVWPAYACAVREDRPDAFHDCLCPAAGAPKP